MRCVQLAMHGSTSHNVNSIHHYQPHTGIAVFLHGTRMHLSIYTYRHDIHAQQRKNTRISPFSRAVMRAASKARLLRAVRKQSDHTILTQKFQKLVHFQKYLFENSVD